MGTQCRRDFPTAPDPTYTFLEKIKLTPYKKIYTIHDTIWVQFKTSQKSLYDELSSRYISTDTTFLQVTFNYHKRYRVYNTPEFFCDVVVDNIPNPDFATLYTWYNVLNFQTDCNSNNYYFKVGFIPNKTGIFSIDPNIKVVYCANKIERNFITTRFIFDLDDCNKDIWLSIPPASRGGQNASSIEKKETFFFKVE